MQIHSSVYRGVEVIACAPSKEIMPEVGNDKNATVGRGGFSAVENALIGPFRQLPRRSEMS